MTTSTRLNLKTWHEPMSGSDKDGALLDMSRGSRGVYEEEWDYNCGVLGCDKGDDDAQWEYLEGGEYDD
jgi:hypothetical protein